MGSKNNQTDKTIFANGPLKLIRSKV
jgi:hypothetical protein